MSTAALRSTTIAAALALAAAIGGCGGDGDDDDRPSRPPATDPAAFVGAFRAATGLTLEMVPQGSAVGLRPPIAPRARYPSFTIRFPRTAEARGALLDDAGGRPLAPDRDGLVLRTPATAAKDYGRGVVLTTGVESVADPRFPALDRAIAAATAGEPTRLPDADRPCAAVGLDPARGREGRCVLGDDPITVVDAGSTLVVQGLRARLVGVAQTSSIPSRGPGYGNYRTTQRVVVVVYRLTNTSDSTLDVLFEARLIVAGRRYGDSDTELAPTIDLDAYRPRGFPLRSGRTVKLSIAIKVPRSVAAQVGRTGQLELPVAMGEVPLGHGRIRLAGARTVGIDEGQRATR